MPRPHEPPDGSPPLERENAAQGVPPLGGVNHETACDGSFNYNEYPTCPVQSRLKLTPIWTDERTLAGWLTDGEAALLREARP
jgi:hypothetical protein